MNDKHKRFVQEYLIDLNATQAAIRSGYSKKTADVQGPRLLGNVRVQEAIQAAMKKREEETGITAARVLNEIAIIAFSDIQNYIEINDDTGAIRAKGFKEMPPNASRALEAIEENRAIKENADGESTTVYDKIKFKMHNKLGALEDLAEHLGLLKGKNVVDLKTRFEIVFNGNGNGAKPTDGADKHPA